MCRFKKMFTFIYLYMMMIYMNVNVQTSECVYLYIHDIINIHSTRIYYVKKTFILDEINHLTARIKRVRFSFIS